jgi:heme/copper-type cytochrome/quinol oxidase subunit 2
VISLIVLVLVAALVAWLIWDGRRAHQDEEAAAKRRKGVLYTVAWVVGILIALPVVGLLLLFGFCMLNGTNL